jgi:hypothetical protein
VDWSQWLYLALLAVATIPGRHHPDLIAILVVDLMFTLAWGEFPLLVGAFDLFCAWALWSAGPRGRVVGGIFVIMQPVYVAGWLFNVPDATTYAIIDVLAYLQLVVLSNADRFLGKRLGRRLDRSRSNNRVASMAVRSTGRAMGVSEKDMRG